jgi:hypothetical protein
MVNKKIKNNEVKMEIKKFPNIVLDENKKIIKTVNDEDKIKIKNSIKNVMERTDSIFDFEYNEYGKIEDANEAFNPLKEIMWGTNTRKVKKFINIYSEMYPKKSIKEEMEKNFLLHEVVRMGNSKMVKMLIEEYKLDVNVEKLNGQYDEYNGTPLKLAMDECYDNDFFNVKIVKLLVENGAQVYHKDKYGIINSDYLDTALRWDKLKLALYLIKEGKIPIYKDEIHLYKKDKQGKELEAVKTGNIIYVSTYMEEMSKKFLKEVEELYKERGF